MSNLYIITTKQDFLWAGQKTNLLISKERAEQVDPGELTAFDGFRSDHSLYRLKNNALVFATNCLDTDSKPTLLQKADFIATLIESVYKNLQKAKEDDKVSKIVLFAHGFDLHVSGGFEKILPSDHYRKSISTRDIFKGKNLVFETNDPSTQNDIPVVFIAFSHIPKGHMLYDTITNYEALFKDLAPENTLSEILKSSDKQYVIEQDQLATWTAPKEFKKYKLKFTPMVMEFQPDPRRGGGAYIPISETFTSPFGTKTESEATKVVKYIQKWSEENSETENRKIHVLFLNISQISADSGLFLKIMSDYKSSFFENTEIYVPTLVIGFKDILNKTDEDILNECFYRLDPRYKFLDSSIWFRYAAIEGNFFGNLEQTLDTISWAYDHSLYSKHVCLEYVEFNFRMLQNSYLESYGGHSNAGHHASIFPFVFHSETLMESRATKMYVWFTNELQKFKWNLLLIDDYANEPLRPIEMEANEEEEKSKGDLIEALLHARPGKKSPNQTITRFEKSESVKSSIAKYFTNLELNAPAFDIILLDYLFSHPKVEPHLGTEFLTAIEKGIIKEGKSLLHSYWIHPISVFHEAMMSDLQEKSYQHFETEWFLARGADPINTPHLFRCSLFEFMKIQTDKLLFDENDLWKFIAHNPIKLDANRNIDRSRAQAIYRYFIDRFMLDEGLDKSSELGKSIKKALKARNDVLSLRDAWHQILYTFSYSSGYEFPIIEREFQKIDGFYKTFSEQNNNNGELWMNDLKIAMDELATGVYSITFKYF